MDAVDRSLFLGLVLGDDRQQPPALIDDLRRRVLSAVLARPAPHSVPGSQPTWPITSTIVDNRSMQFSLKLNF